MSDDLRQPIGPDDTIIAHGVWHGVIDPRHPPHWVDYLWTHTILGPCGPAPVVSDSSPGPAPPLGEVARG